MNDDGSTFQNKSADVDREQIVADAIGDSVVEPLLFQTSFYPRLDQHEDSKAGILPGPIQRVVRTLRQRDILTRPVIDFLEADEQPHFILYSTAPVEEKSGNESRTYEPEGYLSLAVITDKRILFLVGQQEDDLYAPCDYSDIETAVYNDSVDDPYLNVHASTEYTIRDCHPADELTEAAEYIEEHVSVEERTSSSYSGAGSTGTGWGSTAREYASKGAETFTERVDQKYVLKCGIRGAKLGGGPKVKGVGFTLGAAYGVYDCIATSAETVDPPDPEDVAETATEWRQEAASADEQTQWVTTVLGASSAFATKNSDSKAADLLADVGPVMGAKALEAGTTVIEGESGNGLPSGDSLPDSILEMQLPESSAKFAAEAKSLLEDGLMDELRNVSK